MEYTEQFLTEIEEAMQDEAFVAKLAAAESKEQYRELFLREKGIEIDDAIAQAAYEKAEYIKNGGELTEAELEIVAGGCRKCLFYAAGFACAGGLVGGPIGAAIGFAVGYAVAHRAFHR